MAVFGWVLVLGLFQLLSMQLPLVMAEPSPSAPSPGSPPSPSQVIMGVTATENHHPYRLSLIQAVGIAVTIAAVAMLIVLMVLIHRKHQELEETENLDKGSAKAFPPPRPMRKFQEGQTSMFQKFSYMETKKATNNFNTVIGQGGFGTVYKAQFDDGFVAAVKRMNMVSEQGEDDFCREIEFLARFHQRQLVALRGFCIRKRER